jgi:predicted small lipoprotein YifL
MKAAIALTLLLALAACGLREPLRLPEGSSPPATPATARQSPSAEQLLTPPPIARPRRVDELLSQSEERSEDRFDLPPADVEAEGNVVDSEDEPE